MTTFETFADRLEAADLRLAEARVLVIAVSGGVDSMALMHLVHVWLQRQRMARPDAVVVTVDHRLRSGSAAEVQFVAEAAARLGFRHVPLAWDGAKPLSGLQAAARQARYRLIADLMMRERWDTLLTAHTRDDQAETVWMRLTRGTGIEGLAGMRRVRVWPSGIRHVRPLLDVSKDDLVAAMRAAGRSWCDDPSNSNPAFERVRVREQGAALAALGLTPDALVRLALRADTFVRYLDGALSEKIAATRGSVTFDALGYFTVNRPWFEQLQALERQRLMARMLHATGGQTEPIPLGALEARVPADTEASSALTGFTLHGAEVEVTPARIRVFREALDARLPCTQLPDHLARLPLVPGATVTWDQRFAITLDPRAPPDLTVGPLTEAGVAALDALGWVRPAAPARVLWTLPALFQNGRIAALPHVPIPGATVSRDLLAVRLCRSALG